MQRQGATMPTPERRQNSRASLERLAYIHIEPNNGGIVLNVSPQGLCFHSIAGVEKNGPLRFSLLEQNRRIPACAELAWTDEKEKIAGLRFTTLTTEARQQIQDWITQPAAPLEEQATSTLGAAILKALPRLRVHPSGAISDSGTSSRFAELWRKASWQRASWIRLSAGMKPSGFAKGLATGLLISALWASVFLLSAHRRDLGESLIHLGERLAGERLAAKASAGERSALEPVAKPKVEKPPAATAPAISTAPDESASQSPPQAAPRISKPSPAPVVRAHTPPESSTKLLARPFATPAKPQPVPLKPQLSIPRTANNSVPQHSLVRGASEANPPPTATAPLGGPSSSLPIANLVPNKLTTRPQPEPANTVQIQNFPDATAFSLPQLYFELGKFKDEMRARDLGDRVTQLGLHPSVVQKGHLWMSAFYVLVGPYGDAEEATRTHQNLLAHGYKPRPLERGSRSFTFVSGLTLAGATLPVGNFTIDWESYVSDATVKFAKGNDVLATANGQWVKRPSRYQRDEYVYLKTSNGSRLLREIHFSGLDRALVFRDSS
jgi:hypothetical protein